MSNRWRPFTTYATFVLLLFFLCLTTCNGSNQEICQTPSSCGSVHNISYPFRLKGDPRGCGDPNYELECQQNNTVFHFHNGKYLVRFIDYVRQTIDLIDAGVKSDNNCSIPSHSFLYLNTTEKDLYRAINYNSLAFLSCEDEVKLPFYVDRSACVDGVMQKSDSTSKKKHFYVVSGSNEAGELADSCRVDMMVLTLGDLICNGNCSNVDVHEILTGGFSLLYTVPCEDCGCGFICQMKKIDWNYYLPQLLFVLFIIAIAPCLAARFLCGVICLAVILTNKWRRRHLSIYNTVEDFLQSQNNLVPIRYSFADIRKMTNNFKDRIGQGGYGSVYRGMLRSGTDVAVKILGKSMANGQEFINEVATIGSIHHVNVVQLIGYCVERSNRALVYEFMPNGSLDKYIVPEEGSVYLDHKKMYEISLGVARGIEYLHRGCNMRILHFDIKPHNILLDRNYIPKVSDFGLAKLYPRTDSCASLTAARGTLGYIAPELFYKRLGAVSSKADVYSFGMLLMEMAAKRKNFNESAQCSSQVYFPLWVYDQYNEGHDLELGDVSEEERVLVKKMIMVALCCIQMKPSDRPPMNKVIEMLEGDANHVQMPQKPSFFPEETAADYRGESTICSSSSHPSVYSTESEISSV